jgi:hypothetical protein
MGPDFLARWTCCLLPTLRFAVLSTLFTLSPVIHPTFYMVFLHVQRMRLSPQRVPEIIAYAGSASPPNPVHRPPIRDGGQNTVEVSGLTSRWGLTFWYDGLVVFCTACVVCFQIKHEQATDFPSCNNVMLKEVRHWITIQL